MMIIITIILTLYSLRNYRKAVLLSASFLLFLPNFTSGIPGVKLLYFISILHIILFYTKGYYKKIEKKYPLWLLIPSVTTCVGYIISDIYGIAKNLPIVIVNCLCYYYYPYIIWHLLDKKEYVNSFLKYLISFFFIVAAYALVELAIGENVIATFCENNGLVEGTMGKEVSRMRFGVLNCSSILPYQSALGMLSALMFFVLLNLKALNLLVDKRKELILLFLLPFCVLLSGSRTQFVVFAICLIPILFWHDFLKTKTAKIMMVIGIIVLLVFSGLFYNIAISIIDSNNSEVGGSTSDLRETQLEICLQYFAQNPVWGNGRNYIWEYVRPYHPLLMGAESIWFPTMVDYGLVGCFNYLFVFIGAMTVLYKRSVVLCFMPLAFLLGKTFSIVIGVEISTLLVFTILLSKMYDYYGCKVDFRNGFRNRSLNVR